MRLVAWNCQEGFEQKYDFLRQLSFDVAVVSECAPLLNSPPGDRELTSVLHLPVLGQRKHLGVFARDPWGIEALPEVADQPWLLPVAISGPEDFTLLAVWALTPGYVGGLSYAAQTSRVIADVLPPIEGPVVLAGDLNAPLASDRRSSAGHLTNVEALASHGLVSAFGRAFPGLDPHEAPTYFHQRRQDQPFHIDHVFVPEPWTHGLTMTVGNFDDWVATGRSDHVPLIVDIP